MAQVEAEEAEEPEAPSTSRSGRVRKVRKLGDAYKEAARPVKGAARRKPEEAPSARKARRSGASALVTGTPQQQDAECVWQARVPPALRLLVSSVLCVLSHMSPRPPMFPQCCA